MSTIDIRDALGRTALNLMITTVDATLRSMRVYHVDGGGELYLYCHDPISAESPSLPAAQARANEIVPGGESEFLWDAMGDHWDDPGVTEVLTDPGDGPRLSDLIAEFEDLVQGDPDVMIPVAARLEAIAADIRQRMAKRLDPPASDG